MLTESDLKVGCTYRAKRPRKNLLGEFDDRTILYVGMNNVQYDSITVGLGRHYPQVSKEKFLRWAKEEIK